MIDNSKNILKKLDIMNNGIIIKISIKKLELISILLKVL